MSVSAYAKPVTDGISFSCAKVNKTLIQPKVFAHFFCFFAEKMYIMANYTIYNKRLLAFKG